jgi:DNA-binding transcriptional MocR family regulator
MIEMQYNFPLLPGLGAEWRERLRQAVNELGDEDYAALRPTFRSPHPEMVETSAQWLRVPAERLVLTDGAHHGSLIAMMAAGLAGRAMAMDAAAYTGALEQARALACPVVGCAVDEEGMTAESLREACVRGRDAGQPVAAVFCTVTVHNPLGCTASLARRRALVEVAREFDLLLLEDDTYGFMEPDMSVRLWDLAPERTFFISSLSKSYVPAARMGFLVGPERFDAGVFAAVKNTATGSSLPHHQASCSLLADGSVDRVIAAKNTEGARRNAAARAVLGARCWPGARCAWHLWVSLPEGATAQAFEARMRERGVCLSGGNWFAACEDAPRGFRMALGGEVDAAETQRGVERVAEELARL